MRSFGVPGSNAVSDRPPTREPALPVEAALDAGAAVRLFDTRGVRLCVSQLLTEKEVLLLRACVSFQT